MLTHLKRLHNEARTAPGAIHTTFSASGYGGAIARLEGLVGWRAVDAVYIGVAFCESWQTTPDGGQRHVLSGPSRHDSDSDMQSVVWRVLLRTDNSGITEVEAVTIDSIPEDAEEFDSHETYSIANKMDGASVELTRQKE